jgi:type IV pilus assembly protein PilF
MREIDMLLREPLDTLPAMTRARAGLCTADSDLELAERYFRQALALDPELGAALFPLVQITYGHGDYLAARGFLERYLAANPKNAESLWYGVRIERQLGATEVEDDYARQLRADFPQSRQARELLGAGG